MAILGCGVVSAQVLNAGSEVCKLVALRSWLAREDSTVTKTLLAALVVALCLVSLPRAPLAGSLRLYSDPALTQCTLSDTGPRTASIYVMETGYVSIGVRFRVASSPGFTGVWLSDSSPYSSVGSSQSDLSMHFGKCLSGTVLALTMTYQLFGTSACSQLEIAPPSGLLSPICFDCFEELPCLNNRPLHINCDGSFDCNPVATEPTTWGSVKALYRN